MKRRSAIKALGGMAAGSILPAGLSSCNNNKNIVRHETDILVVGGGTAGVIAAIQAGRAGCKTILLENGSQLGGTVTTGGVSFPGLFHAWGKQVIGGIGWELVSEAVAMNGDELPDFTVPFGRRHPKHQVPVNIPLYVILAEEKCIRAGVNLRYYETPVRIAKNKHGWEVDVAGKGASCKIICKQLIDCTGNALITSMAGYKVLKENDTQPGSLIFELGGYEPDKLDFEDLDQRYKKAIEEGLLYRRDAYQGIRGLLTVRGGLATQHILKADSTTSVTHTQANIEGRASMLRILQFVKTLPGCEKACIKKMQPETAVRETGRIDGLYRITHEDYMEGTVFDDSLSYSYYPVDLHVEEGVTPKHPEEGKVATIPLRALIPKDSENLIVAGRCVSSDRLANSALRVQASCMGMGQVAGATAALACANSTTPSEVPLLEIKTLIKKHNGIEPA